MKDLSAKDLIFNDIPVVINNFNRVDCLTKLISWFEDAGMKNIYIIDNASSYPKLLEYYENCRHTVIKLSANIGYKSIWDTNIHLWFKDLPYIYTDPDIIPIEDCPKDCVKHFLDLLDKYPDFSKVGFGLKIDDIPDYYEKKQEVIDWESKFWEYKVSENVYKADIDTTFALYRPNTIGQQWGKTLRTSGIYMARHLPWYEKPDVISEEELFYRNATIGSSWYSNHKEAKLEKI